MLLAVKSLALAACLLCFVQRAEAGTIEGIAPCVVFLVQDVPPATAANIGSGLLVEKEGQPILVTADHVAKKLGDRWKIVMVGKEGRAEVLKVAKQSWRESPDADVAIAVLMAPPETRVRLRARALPSRLVAGRPLPPERDVPLTVMGYPKGLGVMGQVSPLSLESKAASGFITMPRFDTGNPARFILLQDPSIGGLSGGPVFDTGKSYFGDGRQLVTREGVSLVGIIHGAIGDANGTLAAVVPADEVAKMIDQVGK